MQPHMIDAELFSSEFVIWINHVGFISNHINCNLLYALKKILLICIQIIVS
jgi:hypothetical protein